MTSPRAARFVMLEDFLDQLERDIPSAAGEIVPDDVTLAAVRDYGLAFVEFARKAPDGPPLAYCSTQWPKSGPALLGMTFAYNARHPDPEALFEALWTEQDDFEGAMPKDQMAQELAHYMLAHFGKPTAV